MNRNSKTSPSRLSAGVRTAMAALPLTLAACTAGPPPRPTTLASPYDRPVVLAVAPAVNQSGVSIVDGAAFSDDLVATLQQIPGVTALPVNRSLEAMHTLEMAAVQTPQDASALARLLDADAVLVPAVNAWYPYEPLEIGVSGVLYAETKDVHASGPGVIDPRLIGAAWSDESFVYSPRTTAPTAATALHLDGADNDVQAAVYRYAAGRHDPNTSLGWGKYLKSMHDFQRFAAFTLVESVLHAERARVAAARRAPEAPEPVRQAEVRPSP